MAELHTVFPEIPFTFNCRLFPFTYNTAFFTDIPGLFTVTLQVNVFLAILAFTVAVPVFTAVIFPFDETFTTLLLEEDHFTAFFQFTTFNCDVFPTYKTFFVLFSLGFAAAFAGMLIPKINIRISISGSNFFDALFLFISTFPFCCTML